MMNIRVRATNIAPSKISDRSEKEHYRGFINRLYYVKPEQFHVISTYNPKSDSM
jgi:hypothetical protein